MTGTLFYFSLEPLNLLLVVLRADVIIRQGFKIFVEDDNILDEQSL